MTTGEAATAAVCGALGGLTLLAVVLLSVTRWPHALRWLRPDHH